MIQGTNLGGNLFNRGQTRNRDMTDGLIPDRLIIEDRHRQPVGRTKGRATDPAKIVGVFVFMVHLLAQQQRSVVEVH